MIAFDYDYSYVNVPDAEIIKRFKIQFKPVTRPIMPWKEELFSAMYQLVKSTDKPIYVLLSGGIDSELVARILLKMGVKFKALTLKHEEGTNGHETRYADWFCNHYKIEQVLVPINISNFITDGYKKYVEQGYRATKIYYYQQLFLLEKLEELGGFGIGGAYEQIYHTFNNQIHLKFNPSYVMPMQWCKDHNTNHQLWFYLETPELVASWMKHELIEFLLQRPDYFINQDWINNEKTLVYHQQWPEMGRRRKASGFEPIENFRGIKEKELQKQFPDIIDMYVPITTIKEQLKI